MNRNARGGGGYWRVRTQITALSYVVSASDELKKMQECCNFVDNLQTHIVFFMCDMRYNCCAIFGWIQGLIKICFFSWYGRKNI